MSALLKNRSSLPQNTYGSALFSVICQLGRRIRFSLQSLYVQGLRVYLSRFGRAAIHAADSIEGLRALIAYTLYCQRLTPIPKVPTADSSRAIDVSIIIPVFNQWHHTQACLNSVLQVGSRHLNYEIILADDGSRDETMNAQRIFPGLRVISTAKNQGFLRNCNHAAQYAKGRYMVLLNNDTVVLPNWLDSLYSTAEHDEAIAIVGSKLLNANGTLQEAGACIFADGTVRHLGRRFQRHAPQFNVERDAHYLSGCSILIRKSFWDEVGGFDLRYQNAYFEDTDLAMTAHAMSMRVVYQPRSEIIHFKHQSYAQQGRAFSAINRKLFLAKWGNTLNKRQDVVGAI